MSRLPNPGGDVGTWGDILNDYLSQTHNSDGTLKENVVTGEALAPNAVHAANLVTQEGVDGQVLVHDSTAAGGIKWDNPALASHQHAISDIDSLAATLNSLPTIVPTSTGNEVRPTATTVFWIGGTTKPTNMQAGDLWFTSGSAVPTVPTGLAASNVTSTSLTLTWTPSSDDDGVTGYEVFRDGTVSLGVASSAMRVISGLTPETTYSFTVRARDQYANWSTLSGPLEVLTLLTDVGGSLYSVYGETYPYPLTEYHDGGGTLQLASSYYVLSGSGWKVCGAKVYIPAGIDTTNMTAKLGLKIKDQTDSTMLTDMLWDGLETWTQLNALVAGQWNVVYFTTPVAMTMGELAWIYLTFDGNYYLHGTAPLPQPVASEHPGLYESGGSEYIGESSWSRSANSMATAGVWGYVNVFYGIDIIMSQDV